MMAGLANAAISYVARDTIGIDSMRTLRVNGYPKRGELSYMRNVLVSGGAGYIGSNMVLCLLDAGFNPIVVDNLATGFRIAIPNGVTFIHSSSGNIATVDRILEEHKIEGVMHFAASVVVPQSLDQPAAYYENNTGNTLRLADLCARRGIEAFVFSSTAAVYGEATVVPVSEESPILPINPYGASKAMSERIVQDICSSSNMRSAILRYFNVAGADSKLRAGQRTLGATHLIKVAVEAAVGKRNGLTIFGDDYATLDGTCVRDYVHVTDLCKAHVLALDHLFAGGDSFVANCGYGRGYSVMDVIESTERVSGRKLLITRGPRRIGDASCVVADSRRLAERLSWKPSYDSLDAIVETAYRFEMTCVG